MKAETKELKEILECIEHELSVVEHTIQYGCVDTEEIRLLQQDRRNLIKKHEQVKNQIMQEEKPVEVMREEWLNERIAEWNETREVFFDLSQQMSIYQGRIAEWNEKLFDLDMDHSERYIERINSTLVSLINQFKTQLEQTTIWDPKR